MVHFYLETKRRERETYWWHFAFALINVKEIYLFLSFVLSKSWNFYV